MAESADSRRMGAWTERASFDPGCGRVAVARSYRYEYIKVGTKERRPQEHTELGEKVRSSRERRKRCRWISWILDPKTRSPPSHWTNNLGNPSYIPT
jgi:hypothetical protein